MQEKFNEETTSWLTKTILIIIGSVVALLAKVFELHAIHKQTKVVIIAKCTAGLLCGWSYGFLALYYEWHLYLTIASIPIIVYIGDSLLLYVVMNWKTIVLNIIKVTTKKEK